MDSNSEECPTGILVDFIGNPFISISTDCVIENNFKKDSIANNDILPEHIQDKEDQLLNFQTPLVNLDTSNIQNENCLGSELSSKENKVCFSKIEWRSPSPTSMYMITEEASRIVDQLHTTLETTLWEEELPSSFSSDDECLEDCSNELDNRFNRKKQCSNVDIEKQNLNLENQSTDSFLDKEDVDASIKDLNNSSFIENSILRSFRESFEVTKKNTFENDVEIKEILVSLRKSVSKCHALSEINHGAIEDNNSPVETLTYTEIKGSFIDDKNVSGVVLTESCLTSLVLTEKCSNEPINKDEANTLFTEKKKDSISEINCKDTKVSVFIQEKNDFIVQSIEPNEVVSIISEAEDLISIETGSNIYDAGENFVSNENKTIVHNEDESIIPNVSENIVPNVNESIVPSVVESIIPSVGENIIPSVGESITLEEESIPFSAGISNNKESSISSKVEKIIFNEIQNNGLKGVEKNMSSESGSVTSNKDVISNMSNQNKTGKKTKLSKAADDVENDHSILVEESQKLPEKSSQIKFADSNKRTPTSMKSKLTKMFKTPSFKTPIKNNLEEKENAKKTLKQNDALILKSKQVAPAKSILNSSNLKSSTVLASKSNVNTPLNPNIKEKTSIEKDKKSNVKVYEEVKKTFKKFDTPLKRMSISKFQPNLPEKSPLVKSYSLVPKSTPNSSKAVRRSNSFQTRQAQNAYQLKKEKSFVEDAFSKNSRLSLCPMQPINNKFQTPSKIGSCVPKVALNSFAASFPKPPVKDLHVPCPPTFGSALKLNKDSFQNVPDIVDFKRPASTTSKTRFTSRLELPSPLPKMLNDNLSRRLFSDNSTPLKKKM